VVEYGVEKRENDLRVTTETEILGRVESAVIIVSPSRSIGNVTS
jgi:hypothetical protein